MAEPLGIVKRSLPDGFGPSGSGSVLERALNLSGAENIQRPYEESVWVYAAVKTFAVAAASVPWAIWTGEPDDEGSRELPESDPLVKLLSQPNKHQTGAMLWEAAAIHRRLDGEDVWFLMGQGSKPVATRADATRIEVPSMMVQVRGRDVEIDRDDFGFPAVYKYPGHNGKRIEFPAASVLHFRDYDPNNLMRGLGGVEVLARTLDQEFQAERYNSALLASGGDLGGFILSKHRMGGAEKRASERSINEGVANPENKGKWKVLDGPGIEIHENRVAPKDMEFGELSENSRNRIAAALGVPLPVIAVLDRATYSNFEHAVQQFWKGGLGVVPYLRTVEDTLNNFLIPRLPSSYAGHVFRFDLEKVEALQEDQTDKWELACKISDGTGISLAEAAEMVGLDAEVPESAKQAYLKTSLDPLEHVLESPGDEPGTVPGGTGDEEEESSGEGAEDGEKSQILRAPDGTEIVVNEAFHERRAYYKAHQGLTQEAGVKALRPKVRTYLRSYQRAQIKRLDSFARSGSKARGFEAVVERDISDELTEADIEVLLLDKGDWADRLEDALGPSIDDIFGSSSVEMAAEIGAPPIDIDSDEVVRFLRTQKIQLKEGVTSTLAKKVRRSLLSAFSDNQAQGSLQEIVRQLLPALRTGLNQSFQDNDARALTIARTETGHASNGARQIEMQDKGIAEQEWVTSGDAFVRGTPGGPYADAKHSHFALDGQVRALDAEFRRGLTHPHDPDAPAGDVINCRCIVRPVIEE